MNSDCFFALNILGNQLSIIRKGEPYFPVSHLEYFSIHSNSFYCKEPSFALIWLNLIS